MRPLMALGFRGNVMLMTMPRVMVFSENVGRDGYISYKTPRDPARVPRWGCVRLPSFLGWAIDPRAMAASFCRTQSFKQYHKPSCIPPQSVILNPMPHDAVKERHMSHKEIQAAIAAYVAGGGRIVTLPTRTLVASPQRRL